METKGIAEIIKLFSKGQRFAVLVVMLLFITSGFTIGKWLDNNESGKVFAEKTAIISDCEKQKQCLLETQAKLLSIYSGLIEIRNEVARPDTTWQPTINTNTTETRMLQKTVYMGGGDNNNFPMNAPEENMSIDVDVSSDTTWNTKKLPVDKVVISKIDALLTELKQ